ncbi:hypothetical protein AMELA_G00070320 [Ameiurus melas]|uniref:Uncharacterized protein n=1 Tax=Ameiurus melas TaxID=219545 RepID=A0A7J6B5N6_AMEME|nr:hypothetical protein AMELA_G00070320 [Ameiurus melas]
MLNRYAHLIQFKNLYSNVSDEEEKREPTFYKVKSDDETEYCLATRFTVQNATNGTWPSNEYKSDAVRFEGEGYYSRLITKYTKGCDETDAMCDNSKSEVGGFKSDAKTNFLGLSIFCLDELVHFEIGDTIRNRKTWMNIVLPM